MKCATHPDVETNLRCGKCGKPICPKCMVQTPVGARCPECAKLYKLPTYRVSARYYLRASGTALGMSIVSGIGWGLINGLVPFFYLNLLLAAGAGYAIGEVISLSVNRKRGRGLATIAGVALVISYLLSIVVLRGLSLGLPGILLYYASIGLFGILFGLIAVGLGIYVAVTRLR